MCLSSSDANDTELPEAPEKRRKVIAESDTEAQGMSNTQSMSMNILLQKLNEMSEDSRRAREQMAREAKADREELRRLQPAQQSNRK